MRDIRLYIDDMRADLNEESLISFNFTLDDTANPTIVKNSFSKSVTLPSTNNNDTIFARMCDLTTRIVPDKGFSPLVRTPFRLYADGELIESGYVQLKDVTTKKGVVTYQVNLFGGLGDFFYALMYREDGEKKTLADLDFGIEGAVDAESEMNFVISKEVVDRSWNSLGGGRNSLGEVITFVPAYNGVPDDFDSKHALVNTHELSVPLPRTYDNGDKSYAPYNGYGLAEFSKELTEWEVNDLRSYLQRPALSVRALISAMAKPENNGGYEIVLDEAFFNKNNSLYHDAYITLPLLSGVNNDEVSKEYPARLQSALYAGTTVEVGVSHSLQAAEGASVIRVAVPISLVIAPTNRDVDTLYDSTSLTAPDRRYTVHSGMVVKVRIYDDTQLLIGESQETVFSTSETDIIEDATHIRGTYTKDGESYVFKDSSGANTFPVEASFYKRSHSNIHIVVTAYRAFLGDPALTNPTHYYPSRHYVGDTPEDMITAVEGYSSPTLIRPAVVTVTQSSEGLPSVASGSMITKRSMLSTDATPADYLLSYTKLFGLRFLRDKYDKKITITPDYFTGEVFDFSARIDRREVTITPNVFDKRLMRLALTTPDTYYAKKYKDTHGVDYAQKRVDTGFSFNNEVEDVYKDNVFTTAVPCRAVSTLFYKHRDSSGNVVPTPFSLDLKYQLAAGDALHSAERIDVYGEELPSSRIVVANKAVAYAPVKGYDSMPKMCYFDQKSDSQTSVGVVNNLVVWCGNQEVTDADGEAIDFWITDDQPEMLKLNDKVCYLITQSADGVGASGIAIKRNRLPRFLNVRLVDNKVYDSFEFAKSRENYLGVDVEYNENDTLYNRYWRGYYEDRMDVNTRIVECMVDFSGMNVDVDVTRHFYFFDGCYWLLNKVSDYNPAEEGLVKCQFIKVKDRAAYKKQ